ncbi:MAG: 3-dehydroquinate dehydratase [Micrococcales bacterium]|nr:3-dehydroquinate dehydratase [Micrococcales bacterium]
MKPVMIINGPNLGRLGAREPEVYGLVDHAALAAACYQWGEELGWQVSVHQLDDEAAIVALLHQAADQAIPVILNPAAFTHYSYALRDAVAQVPQVIEVHLTNPAARETFRQTSVISAVVEGTIAGFGIDSYRLALAAL